MPSGNTLHGRPSSWPGAVTFHVLAVDPHLWGLADPVVELTSSAPASVSPMALVNTTGNRAASTPRRRVIFAHHLDAGKRAVVHVLPQLGLQRLGPIAERRRGRGVHGKQFHRVKSPISEGNLLRAAAAGEQRDVEREPGMPAPARGSPRRTRARTAPDGLTSLRPARWRSPVHAQCPQWSDSGGIAAAHRRRRSAGQFGGRQLVKEQLRLVDQPVRRAIYGGSVGRRHIQRRSSDG